VVLHDYALYKSTFTLLTLLHFNGESDSSGIIDSCSGRGRPPNHHPTAKINKVKYLALIFRSVSLPHQDFTFCQKDLEQVFFCVFSHSYPFMRRLSAMVNLIAVTTLLLTSGLHRG